MDALLVLLLAAAFCTSFSWPRWWLSLAPIALAIGLIIYTVLAGDWKPTPSGDNEGAIEFLLIVVLTVLMELALLAGALVRAGYEKRRLDAIPVNTATRAGAGTAFISLLFILAAATLIDGRATVLAVLSLGAIGAGVWFARRSRGS
jgi:hypothetical protein